MDREASEMNRTNLSKTETTKRGKAVYYQERSFRTCICAESDPDRESVENLLEDKALSARGEGRLGLFRNDRFEYITEYLMSGAIDAVCLCGSESEYYRWQLQKVMLFKDCLAPVFRMSEGGELEKF